MDCPRCDRSCVVVGRLICLARKVDFRYIIFILFAQRLFDPLRQFAEKFTAIQAGFTAVERLSDILNEPIEIRDPDEEGVENGECQWRSPSRRNSI